MNRTIFLSFVLVAAGAACSPPASPSHPVLDQSLFDEQPDSHFALTMRDIRFEPTSIQVEPSAVFAVEITNAGEVPHDFSIERIEVSLAYGVRGDLSAGHDSQRAVHVALRPGGRAEVRLKIAEPGEYTFFCDEPGHRRGGMAGTIIVR